MRFLLLLTLLAGATTLSAQFGVSGYYNMNSNTDRAFADLTAGFDPFEVENGYEAAVHYWFRLKNKRVEFLPTAYFAFAETPATDSDFNEIGFQFKTNVYVFDFGGDCDCPTFGKQGPALEKGFFLQLSPGVARYTFGPDASINTESRTSFTLGGGIGLDIGVSNLLTITPFAGVRYGLNSNSEVQFTDVNGQPTGVGQANLLTTQLGLTVTFRLDKKRY